MEEMDIKYVRKKINKNLKVYQKIIVELIKMPLIKLKDQLVLIK